MQKVKEHLKNFWGIYAVVVLGLIWLFSSMTNRKPSINYISSGDNSDLGKYIKISIDGNEHKIYGAGEKTTSLSNKDYTASFEKFGTNKVLISAWYDKSGKGSSLLV